VKLKFKIVFLQGEKEVAVAVGVKEIEGSELTVGEMEQVVPTEQLLEKLLGLRVHVEQV
jgi:hypothetical protein